MEENPSSELFVILVWCLMSLLSMSVIASIPADRPGTSGNLAFERYWKEELFGMDTIALFPGPFRAFPISFGLANQSMILNNPLCSVQTSYFQLLMPGPSQWIGVSAQGGGPAAFERSCRVVIGWSMKW